MNRSGLVTRVRAASVLLLLSVTLVGSGGPVHANHTNGGSYNGSIDGGGTVQFTVAADGSKLDSFSSDNVPASGCTFGPSSTTNIPITNHTFTLGSGTSGYNLTGSFPSPGSASGTIRIRTFGPGACDTGTKNWSATGPSPTPTPTPSPTPSPTPNPTPSPTPSPTPNPTPTGNTRSYAGFWVGGTSQGRSVAFTVNDQNVITQWDVQFNVGTCQTGATGGDADPISNDAFMITTGGGGLSMTFEGQFTSATNAGGTISASLNSTSPFPPECWRSEQASWAASTGSPSPAPSPTSTPGPSPSPSPISGIAHGRAITLSLKRHLKATGLVLVSDGFVDCLSGVPITIQRKRGSGWDTVKRVNTSSSGNYRASLPDDPGIYRARASIQRYESGDSCKRATSDRRRHRH